MSSWGNAWGNVAPALARNLLVPNVVALVWSGGYSTRSAPVLSPPTLTLSVLTLGPATPALQDVTRKPPDTGQTTLRRPPARAGRAARSIQVAPSGQIASKTQSVLSNKKPPPPVHRNQ